ncbi:MAG TPA: ABC transporter permease [Chryseolinea sp.]
MKEIDSLPKWAERFLRAVCPESLYEEIEGDLIQQFNRNLVAGGKHKAKRTLFVSTIRYMRCGILFRNRLSTDSHGINLLSTYFTLAGRNFSKHKVFSFINVLGLAVAITAFFYIIQYIAFETSFDRYHANHDRIYRIALEQYENNSLKNAYAKSYPGIYRFLNESIPEVETATRFIKTPANTGFLFGRNNRIFNESGGFINADANFFKVFPTLLVRGNAHTALKNPNSIVISESIAKKVFGNEDPLGQRLDPIGERSGTTLIVTGILSDISPNTHFHANFVAKVEDVWPEVIENDWAPTLIFNYALLKEKTDPAVVASKVNKILDQASMNAHAVKGAKAVLQPLTDIHLQSHFSDEYEGNGNQTLVYLLLAIGIIILLMSWINYINIETARFLKRAKEVGVRRIVGSQKSDLIMQFLVEYFFITAIAIAVAGGVIASTTFLFSNLTGIAIDFSAFYSSDIGKVALLIVLSGTVVTGIYPGLYLIKLKPSQALRGSFNVQLGRGFVRRPLLIIQFSASITLIAFLLVVNSQLDYMQVTNKKIEVEKVIAIRNPVAYANIDIVEKYNHFRLFNDKLVTLAPVGMVATSSAIPGTEIGFTYVDLIKRNLNDPYDPTGYKTIFVGENFLPLYGINLLAGRNFSIDNGSGYVDPWERKDWLKIIINEKAAKTLGFKSPQDAVNQVVKFKAFDDFEEHEIIGIIEDYHHEAVRKEISPVILKGNFNSFQQVYYSIRLNTGVDPRQAIDDIHRSWKDIFPEYPFEYFFLDDYYDQQFKSERQFSAVFSFFAGVAILIACLGVLGMALFESNARIREISIRKVLGASAVSLLALLSRDQARCILLSWIISFPTVWYGARVWLSSYPLQVSFSPLVLLLPAAVIACTVTVLSGVQALKVVSSNPVDHLKDE